MRVQIAGKNFEAESVDEYDVRILSEARRESGVQQRKDNTKIGRYIYGHDKGIGFTTMDRETGRGVGGMLSTSCDCRFDEIQLMLLHNAVTNSGVDHCIKMLPPFKSQFVAIFETDYDDSAREKLKASTYTPDSWATGGDVLGLAVDDAGGCRGFDACVHKGYTFVVGSGVLDSTTGNDEFVYKVMKSALGSTSFNDASGSGFPDSNSANRYVSQTITRRNTFTDDGAKIMSFGNTLIVAIYEDFENSAGSAAVDQIRVGYSTDIGANWTFNAGLIIPALKGVKALTSFVDSTGTKVPILVTTDNIYALDIANNNFSELLAASPLTGDSNDGRWAIEGADGNLYVPLGSGDILRIHYNGDGTFEVRPVGPATRSAFVRSSGITPAYAGHANYLLVTPSPWLFVAYGGHSSSKNATVLAYEYDTGAWFPVYQSGTANRDIIMLGYSTVNDGVPRIHIAHEHADASVMEQLEEVLIPAASGVTMNFEASGLVNFPRDDFADPHSKSILFQALLAADDLGASTSAEYVAWNYGADGASYTSVDAGDFLSGDKDLVAAAAGVSLTDLKNQLVLNRDGGNTTDTPKVREFEVQAKNVLADLDGYVVVIDIAESAKKYASGARATETILSRLKTIRQATTLQTFKYGRTGTKYVEQVVSPPSPLTNANASQPHDMGQRTGFVTLHLEEVI